MVALTEIVTLIAIVAIATIARIVLDLVWWYPANVFARVVNVACVVAILTVAIRFTTDVATVFLAIR